MITRVFDHLPDGFPITACRLDGSNGAYAVYKQLYPALKNVYTTMMQLASE